MGRAGSCANRCQARPLRDHCQQISYVAPSQLAALFLNLQSSLNEPFRSDSTPRSQEGWLATRASAARNRSLTQSKSAKDARAGPSARRVGTRSRVRGHRATLNAAVMQRLGVRILFRTRNRFFMPVLRLIGEKHGFRENEA